MCVAICKACVSSCQPSWLQAQRIAAGEGDERGSTLVSYSASMETLCSIIINVVLQQQLRAE